MVPQGHKPSLMMTEQGPVNLQDGFTYTSVNGRVYLPNLRKVDGWNTRIAIKNLGAVNTTVQVKIRDLVGNFLAGCGGTFVVAPVQRVVFSVPCGATGTVDADQNISVETDNQLGSPVVRGANEGIPASSLWNPQYVPLVAKNNVGASGTAYSDIYLQNPTSASMPLNLLFTPLPGTSYLSYIWSPTLGAFQTRRARLNIDSDFAGMPNGWIGSVKVTAGALAVTSDFLTWSGQTDFSYNAFSKEKLATQWAIPLFMVRNSGLTGVASTPINVQNVSGYTLPPGYITLNCYAKAGSGFSNFSVANDVNVSPDAAYSFNPATDYTRFPMTGWLGSCQVVSAYSFVVLAQIRYPANQNASAYQAIPGNGTDKSLHFPVIEKRLGDGSATAILVQNLSPSSSTNVTFFYKASCPGYSDVTVGPHSISPNTAIDHNHRLVGTGSGTGYHGLPDGWCGSLTVASSSQPIAGFGQLTNYLHYTSGDTILAYSAISFP